MAATYTLISSNVLSASAASVTFSSIPATYTDLVLRFTARSDRAIVSDNIPITFNGTATGYSRTYLVNNGGTPQSANQTSTGTSIAVLYSDGANATANTFSSGEVYIPSYTVSQNKPVSSIGMVEDNNATGYAGTTAHLWSNTAAITSITVSASSSQNFVAGSSFYLYGIKNA